MQSPARSCTSICLIGMRCIVSQWQLFTDNGSEHCLLAHCLLVCVGVPDDIMSDDNVFTCDIMLLGHSWKKGLCGACSINCCWLCKNVIAKDRECTR